jgi:hypothetical protein
MNRICRVILAAAAVAALAAPAMGADKLIVRNDANSADVLKVNGAGTVKIGSGTVATPSKLDVTEAIVISGATQQTPTFAVYNSNLLRTKVRIDGVQEWLLNTGGGEAGKIAYATPGGGVGFALWNYDTAAQTYTKNKFTMTGNLDNGLGIPVFTFNYDATTSNWLSVTLTGVGVGNTWNPRAELEVAGTLMINNTPSDGGGAVMARPACAANKDGGLFYTQGTAGVASKLELCQKAAGGTYSWVLIK